MHLARDSEATWTPWACKPEHLRAREVKKQKQPQATGRRFEKAAEMLGISLLIINVQRHPWLPARLPLPACKPVPADSLHMSLKATMPS